MLVTKQLSRTKSTLMNCNSPFLLVEWDHFMSFPLPGWPGALAARLLHSSMRHRNSYRKLLWFRGNELRPGLFLLQLFPLAGLKRLKWGYYPMELNGDILEIGQMSTNHWWFQVFVEVSTTFPTILKWDGEAQWQAYFEDGLKPPSREAVPAVPSGNRTWLDGEPPILPLEPPLEILSHGADDTGGSGWVRRGIASFPYLKCHDVPCPASGWRNLQRSEHARVLVRHGWPPRSPKNEGFHRQKSGLNCFGTLYPLVSWL